MSWSEMMYFFYGMFIGMASGTTLYRFIVHSELEKIRKSTSELRAKLKQVQQLDEEISALLGRPCLDKLQ